MIEVLFFSGLVCDCDNKTIEALKDEGVYQQLVQDLEINRLECLSHATKRMKINLCNRQDAVLKEARDDKNAEVRYLMKEKQMNKQEPNKTIGKKYVGTLKADSSLVLLLLPLLVLLQIQSRPHMRVTATVKRTIFEFILHYQRSIIIDVQ